VSAGVVGGIRGNGGSSPCCVPLPASAAPLRRWLAGRCCRPRTVWRLRQAIVQTAWCAAPLLAVQATYSVVGSSRWLFV